MIRRAVAVAVVAAAVACAAGCGVTTEDKPRRIDPTLARPPVTMPTVSTHPMPTTTPPPTTSSTSN